MTQKTLNETAHEWLCQYEASLKWLPNANESFKELFKVTDYLKFLVENEMAEEFQHENTNYKKTIERNIQ